MADELVGNGLVAERVGGISESSSVQQTKAEPVVDPVASGIHLPAGVVTERCRLRGPCDQVLNVAPRQLTTVRTERRIFIPWKT